MGDLDDQIVVRRSDLVAVLQQLEMLVVSLDHVGSAIAELDETEQARERSSAGKSRPARQNVHTAHPALAVDARSALSIDVVGPGFLAHRSTTPRCRRVSRGVGAHGGEASTSVDLDDDGLDLFVVLAGHAFRQRSQQGQNVLLRRAGADALHPHPRFRARLLPHGSSRLWRGRLHAWRAGTSIECPGTRLPRLVGGALSQTAAAPVPSNTDPERRLRMPGGGHPQPSPCQVNVPRRRLTFQLVSELRRTQSAGAGGFGVSKGQRRRRNPGCLKVRQWREHVWRSTVTRPRRPPKYVPAPSTQPGAPDPPARQYRSRSCRAPLAW